VTRYSRVRHRILQTPVVRFRNPETGRSVTVVATVHVGPAAYYERLRTIINELESAGAVVCNESAGPTTKQEWAAASDEERAAWDGERRQRPVFNQAARRYLGWVDQPAARARPPSWRNADMPTLEYLRRAGPQNLLWEQHGATEAFTGLTQDQQEAFAGAGYAVFFRLAPFVPLGLLRRVLTRLLGDAARSLDNARVEERNRHVLASLPPGSDAVLPWGGAHLAGLAAGLRKAGYRRRDTTWVTVGQLPAFWPSLKAWWAGTRAFSAAPRSGGDNAPPSSPSDSPARGGPSGPADRVKHLLVITDTPRGLALPPAEQDAWMKEIMAWYEKMGAAGQLSAGKPPLPGPSKATTFRASEATGGAPEAVSSFATLETDTVEEAIEIAKSWPGANRGWVGLQLRRLIAVERLPDL
jgi:hypothetical protein